MAAVSSMSVGATVTAGRMRGRNVGVGIFLNGLASQQQLHFLGLELIILAIKKTRIACFDGNGNGLTNPSAGRLFS